MEYDVLAEADETAAAVWVAPRSPAISLPLSDDESVAHEEPPETIGFRGSEVYGMGDAGLEPATPSV